VNRRYRPVFAFATVLLILAACDSTAPEQSTTTTTSTSTVPQAVVDRLVVLDGTGNIVTMDRAGADVAALTADAGGDLGYFQPSWSPDASSIVASRVSSRSFSLVAFDLATDTQSEVATEGNAFYVHWSPAGDRLAYLSNGAAGMGLSIAEFGAAPSSSLVDHGQPFYFTWSPDGGRLATLIGQQRFEVRDVADGAPRRIAEPGAFQNPAWTDAGIFYLTHTGGADQLVVGHPGNDPRVLARTPAETIFTVPASGDRVAVQAVGEIDGVSASWQEAPLLPLNRLVVVETATGELTAVTDSPVIAFFWDPAGEQLLVLDVGEGPHAARWSVWAGGELRELVEFVPSQVFLQSYLPFFGQYALSTTMWSPDGTAFAFAGFVGTEGGIYVQDVAGGDPVKVADGSWVMWSPR
jgi:Tol biopolymer transport system component